MLTRRNAIGLFLGGTALLSSVKVWAQPKSAGGTLARLREAQVVKVGVADQPPYSSMSADGTLDGMAPTLAQYIMAKLGVPKMEGSVGKYGELIPGMQAGRWDFVAAALTVAKKRCDAVRFSDPFLFDGDALFSVKGKLEDTPRSVKEVADRKLSVGVQAGGEAAQYSIAAGVSPGNRMQFPDSNSVADGLLAGRVDVGLMSITGIKYIENKRNVSFDIAFPIPDSTPEAGAFAFRKNAEDDDLVEAFHKEMLLAYKDGVVSQMADKFGFETPTEDIIAAANEVCSQ